MSDPLRFPCPSCGASLTLPAAAAGAEGPCPRCGQTVRPPGPAAHGSGQDTVLDMLARVSRSRSIPTVIAAPPLPVSQDVPPPASPDRPPALAQFPGTAATSFPVQLPSGTLASEHPARQPLPVPAADTPAPPPSGFLHQPVRSPFEPAPLSAPAVDSPAPVPSGFLEQPARSPFEPAPVPAPAADAPASVPSGFLQQPVRSPFESAPLPPAEIFPQAPPAEAAAATDQAQPPAQERSRSSKIRVNEISPRGYTASQAAPPEKEFRKAAPAPAPPVTPATPPEPPQEPGIFPAPPGKAPSQPASPFQPRLQAGQESSPFFSAPASAAGGVPPQATAAAAEPASHGTLAGEQPIHPQDSRSSPRKKRGSASWITGILALVTGLGAGFVIGHRFPVAPYGSGGPLPPAPKPPAKEANFTPPPAVVAQAAEKPPAAVAAIPPPSIPLPLATAIHQFLDAPDRSSRMEHALFPERLQATKMDIWYAAQPEGAFESRSLALVSGPEINSGTGTHWAVVNAVSAGYPAGLPVIAMETDEGWKVDWEAFAAFQQDSFSKFTRGERGNEGRFHLLLKDAQNFPAAFPGSERLSAFRISSPVPGRGEGEKSGFAGTGTDLHSRLASLAEAGGGRPVVLDLAIRRIGEKKAYIEITGIAASGWAPR